MSTQKPSAAPKPRHVPGKRPGKKGGKRDENRRQRVSDLCHAGISLMLGKGIEAVTVDEIARAAGVAKGSFYRYFKDKSELVETMLEPMGSALRGAFDTCHAGVSAAEDDAGLLAGYLAFGVELQRVLMTFPREILLYLQECRAPRGGARDTVRTIADEVADRSIALTEIARQRGLLSVFDPRVSALTVIGAVERMLFEVLTGKYIGSPQAAAEGFVALVMDGMRPRRSGD